MSENSKPNMKSDSSWSLTVEGFTAGTNRALEGLFTLGNGYLHVRGSLEEHLRDAPQNSEYMRMPTNVTAEKFAATGFFRPPGPPTC